MIFQPHIYLPQKCHDQEIVQSSTITEQQQQSDIILVRISTQESV